MRNMGRSALAVAGIGIGALALGGFGVAAATDGASLILGHANTATHTTKLADPNGTPLSLNGGKSKAPLIVNSKHLVANLNAQYVGGKTASQLSTGFESRIAEMSQGTGTVLCPSGTRAIAGGVIPDTTGADDVVSVAATIPNLTNAGVPNGWFGAVEDTDSTYGGDGYVYVTCTTGSNTLSMATVKATQLEKAAAIRVAHAHAAH
jgi:hypothetical protein